jgi:hypothetical protein
MHCLQIRKEDLSIALSRCHSNLAPRIVITNESKKKLNNIFYDVDYNLLSTWNDNFLYFHAYWFRDSATVPAKDFQLLPTVNGRGRFLGANVGVNANPSMRNPGLGKAK